MIQIEQSFLSDVAIEVLCEMAFLLPGEPGDRPGQQNWLFARVRFSGPFDGTLVIGADPDVTDELASNMLCLDEPATPQQMADALAEAANVICGNLLPKISSDTDVFDVDSPEMLGDRPPKPVEPTAVAKVCLDAGHVELELYLDSGHIDASGGHEE